MVKKAFFGGKRFGRKKPLHAQTQLACPSELEQAQTTQKGCQDEEEDCCCRICFELGSIPSASPAKDKDLIQPCGCLGSMTYVHPACLAKWRSLCTGASKNRCGVCLEPYSVPLSPMGRLHQLACLLPSILSVLCICLVICSATTMPQWLCVLIAILALMVLARYQSVTSLVALLMMSSMLGLYIRGLQLVAQNYSCGNLCLALSRQTSHRPCFPHGNLLGAALSKRRHQQKQQQDELQLPDQKVKELEWRWPDSLTLEEDLFEDGPCDEAGWKGGLDGNALHSMGASAASGSKDSAVAQGSSNSSTLLESCRGCASSVGYVWPMSVMVRLGWV